MVGIPPRRRRIGVVSLIYPGAYVVLLAFAILTICLFLAFPFLLGLVVICMIFAYYLPVLV